MKKQFFYLIAAIVFLMTGAAAQIAAQSIKVNIGFDFQVGKKIYPAGAYIIEKTGRQDDNLLHLRSLETGKKASRLIAANLAGGGGRLEPKLVFERRGNEYALSQIFFDESGWGYALPKSRQEKSDLAAVIEVPLGKQ
jgi:hypothetical protein